MSGAVAIAVRQNTPAWLDARRDVVGSSDIAVITGNSPYRTSLLDLWAVKTRLLEPETPDAETQEMYDLGHALEPVIADRYTIVTGRPVRRAMRLLVHPRHRWMGASLDRVVKGERCVLELKWNPHRRFSAGPEPVPAHVQDQVQWQLMVSGFPLGHVAVLNGSHFEWYVVEADPGYQADLLTLGRWFMRFVETRERPPLDGSELTRRTLARMYPRDNGLLMPPTLEMDALAAQLREQDIAFEDAKEALGKTKNTIRGLLENYSGVEGDGYRISFRRSKDGTKTNWPGVVRGYRTLLEDAGVTDAAVLDAIVDLHSAATEGYRSLLPKWLHEETGKWL